MKQPLLVPTSASAGNGLTQPRALTSGVVSDDLIHELRQPLGVIETLAYYLELTSEDEKTISHARQIKAMVGEANRILSTDSGSSARAAVLPRSTAS